MEIINKINMDLGSHGVKPLIDVVQGDAGTRKLQFILTHNKTDWEIPAGTAAVVNYIKLDGKGGIYDKLPDDSTAYSISGNTVTVILAPQVLTVHGLVQLTVTLVLGEKLLSTFAVDLQVHYNPGAALAASENFVRYSGFLARSEVDATLTKSGQAADAAETGKVKATVLYASQRAEDAQATADAAQALAKAAQSAALDAGQRAEDAYQLASEGGGGIFVGSPEDAPEDADLVIDPNGEETATLPNPYALTFKGAVEGSYDGSAPLEVEIPAGSSGGGETVTTLMEATVEEDVADYSLPAFTEEQVKRIKAAKSVYFSASIQKDNAYTFGIYYPKYYGYIVKFVDNVTGNMGTKTFPVFVGYYHNWGNDIWFAQKGVYTEGIANKVYVATMPEGLKIWSGSYLRLQCTTTDGVIPTGTTITVKVVE